MKTDSQYHKVIDWLLEPNDPVVRYRTLCTLCGDSEDNTKIGHAKTQLLGSRTVAKILSKQQPAGYWGDPDSPYLPKYNATYWNLILLAQMGLKRSNPQIAKAVEHIFKFQQKEGGFSIWNENSAGDYFDRKVASLKYGTRNMPQKDEWVRSHIRQMEISCLTGNMCAALLRFGYIDDPRVDKALSWLVEIQFDDGGWQCPYWKTHEKDTHSCFMGTIAALEACAKVPAEKCNKEIQTAIKRGAEFMLMHRLYRADHHDWQIIKPHFVRLRFPWFYGYDFLRGLWVLSKLGYASDPRTKDAIQLLLEKRLPDGSWPLEKTLSGRMLTNFGAKGKPNKWITLLALEVLMNTGNKNLE